MILESVDSEVFDKSPFQPAMGTPRSGGHGVSSPFEIAQYPIEIQEGKRAIQRQISQRYGFTFLYILKLLIKM